MVQILSKAAERRRVITGLKLSPTGHSTSIYLPMSRVTHHLSAPVVWNGKEARLYFQNYRKRTTPKNVAATDLFHRDGFEIHGPATLEVDRRTWHCLFSGRARISRRSSATSQAAGTQLSQPHGGTRTRKPLRKTRPICWRSKWRCRSKGWAARHPPQAYPLDVASLLLC